LEDVSADLAESLRARVERAKAAAVKACADAAVLVELSTALREGTVTTRCAWCGRHRVDDRWLPESELPAYATRSHGLTNITHGICSACVRRLRATGRSV